MDRFWEWLPEPFFLWAAHWLACPERPVKPLKKVPSIEEVSSALALEEPAKAQEALDFCRWLFEREEDRTKILESKATTLTGFAGVTAALVLGVAALLLDPPKLASTYASVALLVLYLILVYCFVRTILCALMVIFVGPRYRFKYPASQDILAIRYKTIAQIHAQRAVDFFDSYVNNRAINEDKAGYLISAQQAFSTAALLLFLIPVLVAGYMLYVTLGPWLQDVVGMTVGWVLEWIPLY